MVQRARGHLHTAWRLGPWGLADPGRLKGESTKYFPDFVARIGPRYFELLCILEVL